MTTCYYHAKLVLPDEIRPGSVLVEDGTIARVELDDDAALSADRSIDCEGSYLSPGFIDIHNHGAGGFDFMESEESVYGACRCHMLHGTTTILPTTVTGSREQLLEFVEMFNRVQLEREGCPHIHGLHLEGPYFAASQAGAQNPAWLRNPEPEEYEEVLRRTDRIRRWSFAVELDGSDRFLQTLHRHGIITSLAHSDADYAQVAHAHALGLSCLTHFYSCMTTVRRKNAYRYAGAIEAGYLMDELYVEAIADGSHLPAELLRLIYKVKKPHRICLVTDSIAAAGLPDGEYSLGGVACIKEDGVAKLLDRSAFAGSVATTDMLVRTFRGLTGAPLADVVRMVSLTPAELLGIDRKTGSIKAGKAADLLVFDEDIQIRHISVGGQDRVFRACGELTQKTNVHPLFWDARFAAKGDLAAFLKRNDSACPRGLQNTEDQRQRGASLLAVNKQRRTMQQMGKNVRVLLRVTGLQNAGRTGRAGASGRFLQRHRAGRRQGP